MLTEQREAKRSVVGLDQKLEAAVKRLNIVINVDKTGGGGVQEYCQPGPNFEPHCSHKISN